MLALGKTQLKAGRLRTCPVNAKRQKRERKPTKIGGFHLNQLHLLYKVSEAALAGPFAMFSTNECEDIITAA